MNICKDILGFLANLENSLNCPICNEKSKVPVRIKTCGHYFCRDCLQSLKEQHSCPKCKEFYEVKDLDFHNIATKCEGHLKELREFLEKNRTIGNISRKPSNEQIFSYKNKRYHVNFTNTVVKLNAKGETPLHLACKKKKLEEVRKLVEAKLDINAKDFAGWAPLHEAVQSKSIDIINYLLGKHCLIDLPGADYVTPLHQAASLDNAQMVTLFLKHGADRDMVDYNGLKPEESTQNKSVKEAFKHKYDVPEIVFEVFLPDKIAIYCHSIDEQVKLKLQSSRNIRVVEKIDMKKDLTHFMVKKSHKLSFKIMQAMLEGLQFVTDDCTDDYVVGNYFIDIPEYVFLENNPELNKGIQNAMISALLKLPKLFDGISFFIEDHTSPVNIHNIKVNKEYLVKLIKSGNGKVLHRPPATRTCETEYTHPFFAKLGSGTYRCSNFIIFEENNPPDLLYNMNELQHKSSRWLIDCIIQYEISD